MTGVARERLDGATEQHPQARVSLVSALDGGTASHAYLFHGPRGVGKADAALAFAASLLREGSPDPDSSEKRALRGSHPDLTWVTPSGAHDMVKEDVVDPIIRGATRTPMEGSKRVFVIERVETMNEAVANRMLKTLEEPAPYMHFVLLTSELEGVVPTIVSRCQSVRFSAISTSTIASRLMERGVDPERAQSCAALSGGDMVLAEQLASDEGDAMRSEAGKIVACALRGVSGRERPWEGILLRAVNAGEQAEAQQLAELEERIDALPKGREKAAFQKDGEQSAHRSARRVRSDSLDRSLRIAALLVRDIAASSAGSGDLVLARDRSATIEKVSAGRPIRNLLSAAEVIDETRGFLKRNVSEELTLQALSFRLDRELAGV
jgi:DNA polymerase-3 subunit delta'